METATAGPTDILPACESSRNRTGDHGKRCASDIHSHRTSDRVRGRVGVCACSSFWLASLRSQLSDPHRTSRPASLVGPHIRCPIRSFDQLDGRTCSPLRPLLSPAAWLAQRRCWSCPVRRRRTSSSRHLHRPRGPRPRPAQRSFLPRHRLRQRRAHQVRLPCTITIPRRSAMPYFTTRS